MTVDKTEYACLKAIVLFRPGTLLIQDIVSFQDVDIQNTYDQFQSHVDYAAMLILCVYLRLKFV